MEETTDIRFQNDYNDHFEVRGVSLDAILAMQVAVRDINPDLSDTLLSVAYAMQPVED